MMANIFIADTDLSQAIHNIASHYKGISWAGIAWQFAPYPIWALWAQRLTRNYHGRTPWHLFIFGLMLLSAFYCWGYVSTEQNMAARAWTGAALGEGLLPVLSLILMGCGVITGYFVLKIKMILQRPKTTKP